MGKAGKAMFSGRFNVKKVTSILLFLSVAVLFLASSCAPRLTVSRNPAVGGTVTPVEQLPVSKHMPANITATAASGYRFANWTIIEGDARIANPNNPVTTITLNRHSTIAANFQQTHTLTFNRNPAAGGNITPASGANHDANRPINIIASPAKGYRFVNWTIAGGQPSIANANSENTTISLNSSAALTANFQRVLTLTVNRNQTAGGVVIPASQLSIPAATPVNIAAVAANGYQFVNWTVASGQAQITNANSASTTVTLSKNATVTANFQMQTGKQFNPNITYSSLTDSRDGKNYRTVKIDDVTWMAENLNYKTDNSWCYGDDDPNCAVYGRLYNWNDAMSACPAGWRLPDNTIWRSLIKTAGDSIAAGGRLKSAAGWNNRVNGGSGAGTDRFGFSAIPGGARVGNGTFDLIGSTGGWRSATEDANGRVYGWRICSNSESMGINNFRKNTSFSIRCVKNDGVGMSITILAPQATGLEDNQNYLPALVQGEFVSNFSGYTGISVLDWERLDEIYVNLFSEFYDDNTAARQDLGRLTPTTHIMGGRITKTTTGYALQMHITRTADKKTEAAYSGTFTFAELDNLSGIRRASLDLLKKLGVAVTETAEVELATAAPENHVSAQTALARGVTAQREGTEVVALSYFLQAAAFNPSLKEAVNRSSILNVNISSGNIGEDARNDIAWRKAWVDRLTETEQFFDRFRRTESLPYTLFYVPNVKQTAIDYQKETITLSTEAHLHAHDSWLIPPERTLRAVWDGLDATKRKGNWGLDGWPNQNVAVQNPYGWRDEFSVAFELLNSRNKVIGRQVLRAQGTWRLNGGHGSQRPYFSVSPQIVSGWFWSDRSATLSFTNVSAHDITEDMTIRVVSINEVDVETAPRRGRGDRHSIRASTDGARTIGRNLQILALTKDEFDVNLRFNFWRGWITGFAGNRVEDLVIPNAIGGDPVIGISESAFWNSGVTRVTIPSSVTSIGSGAFNSNIAHITIGANVDLKNNSFANNFTQFYNQNGKRAGTYTRSGDWNNYTWTYSP